jgi:hypothetical protein
MKNHDLTTIHQRAPVTQIRRENQAKFKSSTGSGRARMKREKEPILDAIYFSREEINSRHKQSPSIPTTAISATTSTTTAAIATVQPCSYPTAAAGCGQASIAGSQAQLSVLQLREVGTFRP